MLQNFRTDSSATQDTMLPESRSPIEPLLEGLSFIRRHLAIMILACLATVSAALLYLAIAVPTYTATAKLVVDAKATPGDTASASTMVEGQIAVIKSEGLARTVIRKLGLAEDPEFARGGLRSTIKSTFRMLGLSKPDTESSVMRRALESFDRKLSAKRVGTTYIVEIAFDSVDPERAAQILNTVAEMHIAAQMDAKIKSSLRSEKWVRDQIKELSSQASAAQNALANYRKNKSNSADPAEPADPGTPPSQLTAKTQADLSELEATAESTAKAYDNFLRVLRYMEAQQQSSPTLQVYLLIEAAPPMDASSPKAAIVLGISIVGGVLLGVAIGMLRDLSDRGFLRTSGDGTVPVVVLQQGEGALAKQNYTPAALSTLRRQNPREEPGGVAEHGGIRRGLDA
ncbi:hypothetical protein JQ620_26650 [Bradyrhizobium sp. AUGA SZCCT0274]|jgi:uncharacterized protein involved in exopolysaccharide biosynthesis|uniref:Wzz/FepE/Etk N-terminal domain-containing protein n=1 Tax=Bradyrhizobium sp. AUGA SZCCT0274 TaxID=2807670 RepID=UPI001BAA1CBF|nr:Wzz/FepE/Etk N-terminal domain-containing protein [Bradyrhizobium sp. AUGA SZCCT0274]MBR1243676.1 hypothetical protein [Bradyrhizobium sp. AUGA SZCCT0274]